MLGLCLSPTRTARAALLGRWAWSTTVEMPELGAAVALAAAAADVTAAVAAAPTVAWQAPIFGSGWQLEESDEPCGAARLHEHVHLTSRAAARPEPTRGAAHSTAAAQAAAHPRPRGFDSRHCSQLRAEVRAEGLLRRPPMRARRVSPRAAPRWGREARVAAARGKRRGVDLTPSERARAARTAPAEPRSLCSLYAYSESWSAVVGPLVRVARPPRVTLLLAGYYTLK